MGVRGWVSSAVCGAGLLLAGCGGSVPQPNLLAGNWLIAGPMPTDQLQLPPVTNGFSLAMTFDVTGNEVTAVGFGNAPCQEAPSSPPPILGPASVSFSTSATGTVAADGSFSMQAPANLFVGAMSIQGKAPQTSSGEWSGNYAASVNSAFPALCTGSYSGTIAATSFPLINGVYVGTGSLETIVNGVPSTAAVMFQATLKQGGTVVDMTTGKPLASNLVLGGSIRVQGSPCFTSGVASSFPNSSVAGNLVVAVFTMDDGSTLSIEGTLTDPTEARLATALALVNGGQCDKNIYQLQELDRQS
ncbi:MAG: hypothetical protein ABSA39_01320 [Edaphobacter sp.]